MDIVYLVAAGAFCAAIIGFALGCDLLQNRRVTP